MNAFFEELLIDACMTSYCYKQCHRLSCIFDSKIAGKQVDMKWNKMTKWVPCAHQLSISADISKPKYCYKAGRSDGRQIHFGHLRQYQMSCSISPLLKCSCKAGVRARDLALWTLKPLINHNAWTSEFLTWKLRKSPISTIMLETLGCCKKFGNSNI